MAKGSSSRSGPPPDPQALRRDRAVDKGEWTELPSTGRTTKAPAWPLSDVTPRELELWLGEWRRPQAIMWETNGQEAEVALFVRALVEAESLRASVASRTLVRQLMEALGISVPGLLRNRWRIVDTTVAAAAAPAKRPARRPSAKERLRLVEPVEDSA